MLWSEVGRVWPRAGIAVRTRTESKHAVACRKAAPAVRHWRHAASTRGCELRESRIGLTTCEAGCLGLNELDQSNTYMWSCLCRLSVRNRIN